MNKKKKKEWGLKGEKMRKAKKKKGGRKDGFCSWVAVRCDEERGEECALC